jgi:hypothetical protein
VCMQTPHSPRSFLSRLYSAFNDHPHRAGETYWRHLIFTLSMAFRFFRVGLIIFVHGLCPFLLEHTSSNEVEKIFTIMKARKGGGETSS